MKYNPDIHHRRSVRLRGYDYASAGAYFLTFVTHARESLFGEVAEGAMVMNEQGMIAQEEWLQTANMRPYIELDAFIVMPDHVHAIMVITGNSTTPRDVGARRAVPRAQHAAPLRKFGNPVAGSLAAIVRAYKSATTRRINALRGTPGASVWQRNYYEHIIRNERELEHLRVYIENNPLNRNPGKDDKIFWS
jgi:REP element-mobilizing transposase RayT